MYGNKTIKANDIPPKKYIDNLIILSFVSDLNLNNKYIKIIIGKIPKFNRVKHAQDKNKPKKKKSVFLFKFKR